MLSTRQKEDILRKAGTDLPPAPPGETAQRAWALTIETLYLAHAAQRAARSLREADESMRRPSAPLTPQAAGDGKPAGTPPEG